MGKRGPSPVPQWFKDQQERERKKFRADQTARTAAFNEWQRSERRQFQASRRADGTTRKPGFAPNLERRRAIADAYLLSARTLADVGREWGLTRERIRQCVEWADPTGQLKLERKVRIAFDTELALLLDRAAQAKPCLVCGSWVLRNPTFNTCSTECAQAWVAARYHIDPERAERHRKACARSYLRRPDKYRPSVLAWAERMLSDNPPPKNRTFHYKDSRATKALEKAGAA